MRSSVVAAMLMGTLLLGPCLAACDKGPVQKAGEKIDKLTGEERMLGKGPAEKAGRKIDKDLSDLKK